MTVFALMLMVVTASSVKMPSYPFDDYISAVKRIYPPQELRNLPLNVERLSPRFFRSVESVGIRKLFP